MPAIGLAVVYLCNSHVILYYMYDGAKNYSDIIILVLFVKEILFPSKYNYKQTNYVAMNLL